MRLMNYLEIVIISIVSILLFTCSSKLKNNLKFENTMEESLVGHWAFDEEGKNDVIDHSNFKSHGKLRGNPKRGNGIVGKGCLEFDGKGDYLEILENEQIPSHLQSLDKGSISVWFKARNIPVATNILPVFYYGNKNGCENMLDASNEGLIIEIAHGDILKESQGVFFTIFNNSCELPSICYDSHSERHSKNKQGLIKEEEWYHFVAVVGKNYNTGYLNGEEINYRRYNFNNAYAAQFFKNAQKHERLWIGKGFWNFAKETYFDGFIDDLRIYSKALNKEEVKKLYNLTNED